MCVWLCVCVCVCVCLCVFEHKRVAIGATETRGDKDGKCGVVCLCDCVFVPRDSVRVLCTCE